MSRKFTYVRQVVGQVLSMEGIDDNAEGVKTDDVRASADAQIEIRQLKAENEAQVRITSLEQDLVEIEGMHEATDEMMAAQREVGDIVVATESFLEKGGLSKDAAMVMNAWYKHATSRVFLDAEMPSMESFAGSSADRMDMTVVSLEGFKETMSKAWEAIKKFFKSIIDKVKGWFKKSEESVEDIAKKLEDRIKSLSDMAKKGKFGIKASDVATAVTLGFAPGKVKLSGDVTESEANNPIQVNGNFSENIARYNDSVGDIGAMAGSLPAMILAGAMEKSIEELAGNDNEFTVALSDDEKTISVGDGDLLGGSVGRVIVKVTDGAKFVRFGKVTVNADGEYNDDVIIKISDYLKALKTMTDAAKSIKSSRVKVEAAIDGVNKLLDSQQKIITADETSDDGAKKAQKTKVDQLKSLASAITSANFLPLMITSYIKAGNFFISKVGVKLEETKADA